MASFTDVVGAVGPEASSWPEKYGPIGVVAILGVAGVVWGLRRYVAEREAIDGREVAERSAMQKAVADLNAKLVETVQHNHLEAIGLLAAQREDHESRYQALLQQHITTSDRARAEVIELANSVTKALGSIARKINHAEGRDERSGP